MEEVFADAGYWIALLNPADQLHRRALSVTAEIAGLRIVTSEMVLVEFLNSVARLGNEVRLKAADTRQRLAAKPQHRCSSADERAAGSRSEALCCSARPALECYRLRQLSDNGEARHH